MVHLHKIAAQGTKDYQKLGLVVLAVNTFNHGYMNHYFLGLTIIGHVSHILQRLSVSAQELLDTFEQTLHIYIMACKITYM